MQRIKHPAVVFVILAAVVVSLACGVSFEVPDLLAATDTPSPGSPTLPAPTATPEASSTDKSFLARTPRATRTPQATQTRYTGILPAPTVRESATAVLTSIPFILEEMDSYRWKMTLHLDGKDEDGDAVRFDANILMEVADLGKSVHLSIETHGNSDRLGNGSIDIYRMNHNGYEMIQAGDLPISTCMDYSGNEPYYYNHQIPNPENVLRSADGKNLIQQGEVLNGIRTDHYEFHKSVLIPGRTSTEIGEIWAAQEGGFLVRLTRHTEGDIQWQTNTIHGVMEYSYDLTDVDQPVDIVLPDACSGGTHARFDFPLPKNYRDQSRSTF